MWSTKIVIKLIRVQMVNGNRDIIKWKKANVSIIRTKILVQKFLGLADLLLINSTGYLYTILLSSEVLLFVY